MPTPLIEIVKISISTNLCKNNHILLFLSEITLVNVCKNTHFPNLELTIQLLLCRSRFNFCFAVTIQFILPAHYSTSSLQLLLQSRIETVITYTTRLLLRLLLFSPGSRIVRSKLFTYSEGQRQWKLPSRKGHRKQIQAHLMKHSTKKLVWIPM